MKYYPLECADNIELSPQQTLDIIKRKNFCDNDTTTDDLREYIFDPFFFTPEYEGKFKKWNHEIMFNKLLNKTFFPMISMKNFDVRSTEWKDVLSTNLVVDMWSKFKMVYKIDNDFFHEIKSTENLITTKDTFDKLPFKCFFIDLTNVENISDFRGAFVYITNPKEDMYGINIYMVQHDNFTFFTYYAWYKFNKERQEIQWNPDDLPKSDFIARTFMPTEDGLMDVTFDLRDDYDPRNDIVVSIFQIMSFIAIDASDVHESKTTKNTYKPRKNDQPVKNKFSEVRMWDVGIMYGQAIRVAKQEYKKYLLSERTDETKERKPTRPHIRRAHWHKYRVGEGRKETKMLWLAPVYVCGNGKEIPVTIREIKK